MNSNYEPQERYSAFIKRMTREERERKLTDAQMVEKLRTQAHWTTEQPWAQIADRLEELSKNG